jgi:hypothetical protein
MDDLAGHLKSCNIFKKLDLKQGNPQVKAKEVVLYTELYPHPYYQLSSSNEHSHIIRGEPKSVFNRMTSEKRRSILSYLTTIYYDIL